MEKSYLLNIVEQEKRLMSQLKRLTDLFPGDRAVVDNIKSEIGAAMRLRDMGLNEGTAIRIVRYAPLGDPIEIKVRGFYLSLRKELAKYIMVIAK